MSDMEEDVGKGSYGKHTCEECCREDTHAFIGNSAKQNIIVLPTIMN